MSMRVLHVVAGYPTPEHPHNQMFIKTQVESLLAAGVNCEVLSLRGRGPRKYVTGWAQVRRALGTAHFDLVHAHYAYCAFVCFGHGVPVVTSLLGSDLVGFAREDGTYAAWSRHGHLALSRLVVNMSAGCIVKSEQMRRVLGKEADVVPNGVDIARFRPLSPERRVAVRAELGLAPGTRYILFAGNPDWPRKRYPLAQQAVSLAAERVACPIELLPLSGQSHEDVVRHMQACDMLLLTSSWEGSPNVVKEAMAAGMAVVSVDVGDARERLSGVSGCRLAEFDTPEAVGAALTELLNSPEPRMGREAVSLLRIEAVAARVMGIYDKALRGSGR